MNLKSNTNFIKSNINNAKTFNTKKPFENCKPFNKKDYGEVPEYLDTIKATVTREKEYFEMLKETQKPRPVQIQMEDDMREELLEGLKRKYDLLSEEYLVKTFLFNCLGFGSYG
jgi:DNA replicative helicase MCM subunit Mcm2 (Cdc46/Mcm family)